MRFGLGLVGILVALAVVGVLAKKQLGAARVAVPAPLSVPSGGEGAPHNSHSVRDQGQQVQEQFRQQLDSALQQQQQRLDKEAQ
ncbi:MAG: hypothetical protein LBE61_04815 [Burkholderiaceae bacterium]|jgi:hypothetical protein|nr:hypothetical protein [Burkholderiaceae bacterium]